MRNTSDNDVSVAARWRLPKYLAAACTYLSALLLACSAMPYADVRAQSRSLTPQERRGKAIYLRGTPASGRELTAVVGELDVPASTVTCAGCHGARGEGKTEGGITAGNLTWQHLLKPQGHVHPSGRRHKPFDEASLARAVVEGVDPDGNELLVAMPRYRMSREDLADLVAYLKRIETDTDPGLTETSVRVAVPPSPVALAEMGQAMRDVVAAYFEEVNAGGGIHGRKIELRGTKGAPGSAGVVSSAPTAAGLKSLLDEEQPFALVGGTTAGADEEVAALLGAEEAPLVGPATLLPHVNSPAARYVFYLLPGVREQARALVNFAAARAGLKQSRLAIVHSEGELHSAIAGAAEAQAKKQGWSSVVRETYVQGALDAARLVASLRQQKVETVFLAGQGTETAFLREAEAAGWAPTVLMLGALAGREFRLEEVSAAFKEKMFVAFPSVPSDVTPAGLAEYRGLAAKYKLAPQHVAAQLSALAAAKIFVEGLKRAGRDLSREKLITALEGLHQFETGVTPRITYGPNRRVGSNGAYVLLVDVEKKQYVSAGGWVEGN